MPWEPHLGAQPLEVLEEEGDREGDASDEDAADLERALLVVAKGLRLLGLALGRRRRVGASGDGGDGIVVRQRHTRGRSQRKGAGTEEREGVPAADAGVDVLPRLHLHLYGPSFLPPSSTLRCSKIWGVACHW